MVKKKIAIVGPESSGKTTIAKSLAIYFQQPWVPEFAREYLPALGRDYEQKDLLEIARGQLHVEDSLFEEATKCIFCDTNLLVIKVWSEYKFDSLDAGIKELMDKRVYDHYLLTYPDIPWEFDPLRESPNDLTELYGIYLEHLKSMDMPFTVLRGSHQTRFNIASSVVKNLLENH